MGEGINVFVLLFVWESGSMLSYCLLCGKGRGYQCSRFVASVRKGEGINFVVLFAMWEREIQLVVENK